MLPSKFKALNSETSEESDSNETPTVTKEALEQKAISQYQIALQLQQKGEWEQTEKVLRNLLKTDIIAQVNGKMTANANAQSSLVHLKYCVTMNLGHCLAQQKKIEKALYFYIKATKLDSGDLNLWFRMGKLAMSIADLNLAVSSFEEGLKCSPNHWPSIDNLVTITYALGDYLACLFYISKGLNLDVGFLKGHIFKEKIFSMFPSLVTGFQMYYPKSTFPTKPDSIIIESEKVMHFVKEAEILKDKDIEKSESKIAEKEDPLRPKAYVKLDSWSDVAKCLLHLFDFAEKSMPQKIAFASIKFTPSDDEEGWPVGIDDVTSNDEIEEMDDKNHQPQEADEEEQGKSGRSNGNLMEKFASSQKRRSARVRSTIRREEPSLAEAFKKLIPVHLLPIDTKREGECLSDELDTMDLYKLFEQKDTSETSSKVEKLAEKERYRLLLEEGYFGTENEEIDTMLFIQEVELSEKNLIEIMNYLLLKLSEKWKLHWPEFLEKYFVHINLIVQQYYPIAIKSDDLPSNFFEDVNVLLFGELLLYEWVKKGKRRGLPSPLGFTCYDGEFSSLFLGKLNRQAAITNDVEFIARSYWLEALLFLHCGDREASVRALQQIIDDERCEKISVKIPNVSHNSIISSKIAATLMKALKRNKSLSQVMDLYNSGYYQEVADILSDSLSVDPESSGATCDAITRPMQYAIILDSYWKLSKFKECLYWTESCLHESLNNYRNASEEEERQDHAKVIVNTLKGIMNLIEKQTIEIFQTLASERLSRLVHTLSSIISHQMEAPENSSEMPIESVSPWIILHYIIKYDESIPNKNVKLLKEDEEEELLASIQILFQGHEYLGRRSWCCFDEGALLFHILDTLYPLTQTLMPESQNLININQQIDQIFYCLYGIQKKHKTRHIGEHNVLGLALTWNRAQQIFIFTRPRELPSYDTVGKCCMSADTEALYLKLIRLVPDNCNPNRLIGEMMKYIDAELDEMPKNNCPLPEEIADIYFLLAHFYYKSKSWAKVWQYSILDICANPIRHTSWAALALSRGTEIETRLNSCETIRNEGNLLSLATTVCRCYKNSLDLDPAQNTLWLEKGTFSYTIHSFCSNVLKKEQNLSIEMYHMLEEQKESMLATALECFLSANRIWHDHGGRDIHDERWLHHYMFGKIAKKKDEEASVYINHYLKAAALLHDIGALYPIVITYNNPQYLAVEALEIYYRVHTCILKTLEETGDKPLPSSTVEVYKQAIKVLAQSPFVTQAKEYTKNEKPKKINVRRTGSCSDEELPVSKDVKDMIQDILGKVESDHSSSNPLKRKLFPIDEEAETAQILQVEASLDVEPLEPGTVSNTEKTTNSSSTSEATKDVKPKGETSSSTSTTSSSKSSSSSSDSSSSSSNSSSSSSSSSDSSSSDSSSESSSDSSSDSSSEPAAKKVKLDMEGGWSQEQQWLVEKCISSLELCRKRFPEHYKSTYHLAHFYFKTEQYKNIEKVKELLLGPQGLFSERKSNNFFNGIWRIPNGEIDRPGSFAAHMGRCTLLLLEFLRESKDYSMLLDLAIHLKITPEADKKYLRDNEREELSKEAATLCVQSLRKKMQESDKEQIQKFILELYYIHKRVNKFNLKEPRFATILSEAYQKINSTPTETGNVLESAVRYCQQQIHLEKQLQAPQQQQPLSVPTSTPTPQLQIQPISQLTQPQLHSPTVNLISSSISSQSPLSSQESSSTLLQGNMHNLMRRGPRTGSVRKPRGRPPGSGLGPRLPRGMSVSHFVTQQSELLLHYAQQNAELTRQLAAQSSTLSNSGSNSGQVLKDRPNLSITPLKPSLPSPLKSAPTSPSTKQIASTSSISVSVSKKNSPQYKPRKVAPSQPQSPLNPSAIQWPSADSFRPPGLSIKPIQSLTKSSSQEVSLQHKILAKKNISAPEKSHPAKLPELPFPSTSELTVRQITPKPRPFVPRSPSSLPRKELMNSISIIPTSSKVDPPKSVVPMSAPREDKPKTMSKPPAITIPIDSSVADALRTFGSTITITTTSSKKPTKIQDEMSITPVQQKKPKPPPPPPQEPCEVIVLDD